MPTYFILPSDTAAEQVPMPVRCMLSYAKRGTPLWTVTTDDVMYTALTDIMVGAFHSHAVHDLISQTAAQLMGPAMGCDSVDDPSKRAENASFYQETMTPKQAAAIEQAEALIEYCTADINPPMTQEYLAVRDMLIEHMGDADEFDDCSSGGYGCITAYGNNYAMAIINKLTTPQSDKLIEDMEVNIAATDEQFAFFSR